MLCDVAQGTGSAVTRSTDTQKVKVPPGARRSCCGTRCDVLIRERERRGGEGGRGRGREKQRTCDMYRHKRAHMHEQTQAKNGETPRSIAIRMRVDPAALVKVCSPYTNIRLFSPLPFLTH
jgi:hypothetical protein